MREIRFRVWNKVVKKMMNQEDLEKTVKELCKNNYVTGMIIPQNKDGIVMQYTGLKDKHEVEIYEGDIVQCNGNKEDLHEVKFGEFHVYDNHEEEVIDVAIGYYLQILESDKFSKMAPFCYPTPLNTSLINRINIKVVGNIYENKELLKR